MKGLLRYLVLLAVVVLVAAACSSDDSDSGTTTTAASTETTAAPSGDVTTIDFWVGFTDYRLDWSKETAAAFNAAHPEYNVQVTGFKAYNDVWDATVLAVDSGQPPALIHFFEAATRQALDAVTPDGDPYFKSVTDAVAGRTEILGEPVILDSVISAARNYYTVNGSFYSMPWNTSSTVMFSNMDMLKAGGITEPPATWAEVTAACDAIAALADGPSSCITWPNHSWFVEQSLGQQGELLANADNGRTGRATEVYLESPGMLAYLEWWKSLSDTGHYLYTGVQRDWDGTTAAFYAGDVAMLIYSSSDTTAINETGTESGFEVATTFMPRNGDVDYVGNLIGGATIWMLGGLDQVTEDGTLAFLNFFSNPENAAAWHQLTGYEAITTEAIDLLVSEGFYDENPANKVASDQLAAAKNTPASLGALLGNFVGIRDVITIAIEDILVNDLDVATRMALAQEEAQKSLDEYESLFGG